MSRLKVTGPCESERGVNPGEFDRPQPELINAATRPNNDRSCRPIELRRSHPCPYLEARLEQMASRIYCRGASRIYSQSVLIPIEWSLVLPGRFIEFGIWPVCLGLVIGLKAVGFAAAAGGPVVESQPAPVSASKFEEGKRLARIYCATCHLFPEPDLLDKKTWREQTLGRMKLRMGLSPGLLEKHVEADLVKAAGVIPTAPMISEEEYLLVGNYYVQAAPANPVPQDSRPPIAVGLKQFSVEAGRHRRIPPSTTLVHISPPTRRVYFADDESKTLNILSDDGADVKVDVVKKPPVVKITYTKPDGFLASGSKHTAKFSFKDTKGNDNTVEKDYTVLRYGLLTSEFRVTPDTSKPGFLWRVHQNNAVGQANNNTRTEQQLAGLIKDADGNPIVNQADPSAVGTAKGPAKAPPADKPWLPIEFEVEGVINFDQGGGSNGRFTPDDQMPGIPGVEGSTDSIAAEIVTYIELPKGLTWMGVNSDDGFKTTGGNTKDFFDAILLGEFDGGRGAADTVFPVVAQEAGVFEIRTTWEEGGGGANIEWWSLKPDGTRVLINDKANGGLKAYRASTAGAQSYLVGFSPGLGATQVSLKPTVEIIWSDAGNKIPQNSIKLKLDGADVTPTIKKVGETLTATYAATTALKNGAVVKAETAYIVDGKPKTISWNFITEVDLAAAGTLFIETEDFDFGKGKWIQDKPLGMSGKYAGGDYKDKGDGLGGTANSDFGIDYFEAAPDSAQAIYRPNTGVEAGKTDHQNIGHFRGAFDVVVNHVVGWNDVGDWMNYTRQFPEPAKNYRVYGRLSSGGAAIHMELAQVTAGQGTPKQTKKKLGEFRPGRATSGWDNPGAFEIFPLLDDAGSPAVVSLGGLATLRLTTLSGNNDQDFIFFQPTTEAPVAPPTGVVAELGQTVNGYQDDFTGATRDPNWKVRGPGGDLYKQEDGLLRVTVRAGDPNHLLYEAAGYNSTNQEVLARIRVTAFGTGDPSRAGLGAAVATNNSQGINLHFRNNTQDGVTGKQFKLLDDARAWGPPGLKVEWDINKWYWLRLRHEPNAGGGTNDVFGKVWAADGQTPEPQNWQLTWNYIPARTPRSGYAGITGSSIDGLGSFEVDYILIKAAGLPQIKVDFSPTGPVPTVAKFTAFSVVAPNRLQLEWVGAGTLQQADSVTGPWTDVANASSPRTITPSGAGKFYRLRQ